MLNTEDDIYANVPNKGKVFSENGKRYWWNFSDAEVGYRDNTPGTAFAPHLWDPNSPVPAPYTHANQNVLYGEPGEPVVIPGLGGKPVRPVQMQVLGMYYTIDQDVKCIDARETPDGRITLWEDSFPLSGYEQQYLALGSTTVEQYEERKKEAIRLRLEGKI